MIEPGPPSYRRRLPHWRLDGAVYFVTWRIRPGRQDLAPNERDLVAKALRHFEGTRYHLLAGVVMNDHVHVLVQPLDKERLQDIVQSWKSYTANRIQRALKRRGSIWQEEYFDRIVREEAEFVEKANYILHNPHKRWPEIGNYPWVWVAGEGMPWR